MLSFHDLMQKAISVKDVATDTVKGNYYRIDFQYISREKAISILNNTNLTKKIDHCKDMKKNLSTYYLYIKHEY